MGPVGLFAYSRHPNYFGELCVWAGVWVMAGPAAWRACGGLAALSPLFAYLLITQLSGAGGSWVRVCGWRHGGDVV